MRVLMVHDYYRQRGGEDESAEQDIRLLRENGHEVRLYSRHNDELTRLTLAARIPLFFTPAWSRRTVVETKAVLADFRPDIVHVQNFFPLISPSVFHAAASAGVPTVFTVRNYRLACLMGQFLRDRHVCEVCLGQTAWPGLFYRCYRRSRVQSLSVLIMQSVHHALRTWSKKVSRFIALTDFSRLKLVEAGLPSELVSVRPNFLGEDPGVSSQPRTGAVFVGRLSEEKGLRVLLESWRLLHGIPLRIVGDGPLSAWVREWTTVHNMPHVSLAGHLPLDKALDEMRRSQCLVMPSIWYETFGRTIMEAYATGTPVIASRLGAMTDLVQDGRTGWLFKPGDSADLIEKARAAFTDPGELDVRGKRARKVFLEKYSAKPAIASLIEIYKIAQGM